MGPKRNGNPDQTKVSSKKSFSDTPYRTFNTLLCEWDTLCFSVAEHARRIPSLASPQLLQYRQYIILPTSIKGALLMSEISGNNVYETLLTSLKVLPSARNNLMAPMINIGETAARTMIHPEKSAQIGYTYDPYLAGS